MKILLLDIETAPNTAFVWGLFKENIPTVRLLESSYTLCWAAKWYGEEETFFSSVYAETPKKMLKRIHTLMDAADAIVHYNGSRFDIPILNKEFLLYNLTPPRPSKQIDLYRVVKQRFKFTSNKLDYIAKMLGVGEKKNTTFELWVDCMKNDAAAWQKMEEYNRHDVILLENVYERLKPWIKGHANHSLYSESGIRCPNCGSDRYTRRGYAYTQTAKYVRCQCKACGNWFRTGRSLAGGPDERAVNV